MAGQSDSQKEKSVVARYGLLVVCLLCLAGIIIISQLGEPNSNHAADSPGPSKEGLPVTVVPVARGFEHWTQLHHAYVDRAKRGGVDLLFLGDSITFGMLKNRDLFNGYFGEWKPLAFGLGGDCTEHLLWRLQDGEVDGLAPKVTVILIGTNNLAVSSTTDQEIILGVHAVVDEVRKHLPNTKVVVLGLLPREVESTHWVRRRLRGINDGLSKLADDKHVWYINLWDVFVDNKDELNLELMPDRLHPSDKGYDGMFRALKPQIAKLMDDSKSR